MAADRNCHNLKDDESSPFLENQDPLNGEVKPSDIGHCEKKDPTPPPSLPSPPPPPPPPSPCKPSVPLQPETYGWTADGVPVGMMGRTPWETGVSHCLGRQDEFCSSDLEVCLLGCVAPCVLYGSNAERLGSSPRAFTSHCMAYTALCLIGNSFFGGNCLAPWLSYNTRTNLRRRFNLEGTFESLARSHGCCESFVEDEEQREQCETACDFTTHVLCHPCALCQEGREIRRRLPHPALSNQTAFVMYPPRDQIMVRDMP